MTPEKCPNCGTRLPAEASSCPNCPMTFTDDSGPGEHPLKQTRLYRALLPALFFIGLGYLVWSIGMGLFRLGERSADYASVPAKDVFGNGAATRISTAPADSPPAAEPETVIIMNGSAAPLAPSSRSTRAARRVPNSPADSSEAAASEWRLRGAVYDLITLRPIAGCRVTLVNEQTNRRVETQTTTDGRYRTMVPSVSGGYVVELEKRGYAPIYLNSDAGSPRDMSAQRRRALASDLAKTFTRTPTTIAPSDGRPFSTDFYLAPEP